MSFAAKLLISVGCVFGLLAAYTAAATWRIETQYPPIGDFVTVQGVRIHYVDSGAGPAVVLLHGASSSLRDFDASILPELARDSRVIAIDRPGYGYSERPTENWPDPTTQANLIHQALLALGVEQPILVGHSWSGSIVLSYLLDHPDHAGGGVLLAGAANAWEGGVSWFVNVAGWPIIGWVFSATVALPLGQLVLNSAIRGAFAPEQPTPGYRFRTAAVLALRPSAFRASTEDVRKLSDFLRQQRSRYDEIKSPLLLITGENDTIVPAWNHADVLASRLPHAHRVDLPGAGHALHHTRRKYVVRLIHAFLRKRL
jgi:pimeloyl-ACP methyl ester carboxylesterase